MDRDLMQVAIYVAGVATGLFVALVLLAWLKTDAWHVVVGYGVLTIVLIVPIVLNLRQARSHPVKRKVGHHGS